MPIFTPAMTIVLPMLTRAEPSAEETMFVFTLTSRYSSFILPSRRSPFETTFLTSAVSSPIIATTCGFFHKSLLLHLAYFFAAAYSELYYFPHFLSVGQPVHLQKGYRVFLRIICHGQVQLTFRVLFAGYVKHDRTVDLPRGTGRHEPFHRYARARQRKSCGIQPDAPRGSVCFDNLDKDVYRRFRKLFQKDYRRQGLLRHH